MATAHIVRSQDFIYTPPGAAKGAKQILVKLNLGYLVGSPVTARMVVFGEDLL